MLAKPTFDMNRMTRFADRIADVAKAASLLRSPLDAGFKARRTSGGAPDRNPDAFGVLGKGFDPVGASPGLHALVERLSALKPDGALCGMAMPGGPQPAVVVPDGARFEEFTFQGSGGTLGYKLYVPSGFIGPDRPLVVMLHGCTQSPDDFAAGTRMNEIAEQENLLVAYPRQTSSGNAQKCWNWFEAKDQRRDGGEPALIAGLTRKIMRDFPVDPTRVFVAGLSAGGAAAAIMAQAYPDLYAAAGVHSGLAAGAAIDMVSAFAAMRQGGAPRPGGRMGRPVPTIVFHGDGDRTVHPSNRDHVLVQARAGAILECCVTEGRAPGGLTYTRTVHADEAGRPMLEDWVLHGAGHAWSGGSRAGSYTEPRGPDASREMVRFFLQQDSARA